MEVMGLAVALPQHHVEKMRETAMVIPIVLVISNVELTIVIILLSLGGRIVAMILQKVNLCSRIFQLILSIFSLVVHVGIFSIKSCQKLGIILVKSI